MFEKIKVGILGCAQIARRSLAPAFLAHAAFDLKAVASRDRVKAERFIVGLSSAQTVANRSYEELVESTDVDLIYCPLPTGMHFEWVMKSLKSGKHVLCEKSLGCNLKEVSDMVNTARANRRFLMESFQFRFHAQNIYVKELLARGTIGKVRQLAIRFGIPPFPEGVQNIRYQKKLGGGALLDNGAYTVKCATYLLGKEIDVIAAFRGGYDSGLGDVDRTGALMMTAWNPVLSSDGYCIPIQAAYGFDHFYQNGYELWGTEGMISTSRAFTAREDFAAPVLLQTRIGREERKFNDDHFARLMDYMASVIPTGDYEAEYDQCLTQARILQDVARQGGSR